MKKIVLIFLIITFFGVPCLTNAETVDVGKFDGHAWRSWDSVRKHHYIAGVIASANFIVTQGMVTLTYEKDYDRDKAFYLVYPKADKNKGKKKDLYSRNDINMILEHIKRNRNSSLLSYSITGITNGQIVEGLDQLYSDYKNRQINLREAIYVVKKQINGASEEEIQAIFEYLRATEDERDYMKLFYKDKMGEVKWASFP